MRTLRKRKNVISGLDPEQELKAWAVTFFCGGEYFGDLKKIGIDQRTDEQDEFLEKAAESWSRLGSEFLRTAVPRPGRAIPWAVEQFEHHDE